MRDDEQGMRLIIDDEVVPAGRLIPLIRAAVSILWQLARQLQGSDGVASIAHTLTLAAVANEIDPENQLLARLALAVYHGDRSAIDDVFGETGSEDELIDFALTAVGAVPAVLPELRSQSGQELLNKLAVQAAADEEGRA